MTGPGTTPVDLDPFSLFHDLDAGDALAVAVSGGSDSLALLFLVHEFLRRHRPRTRLLAVTVDHGLRPASAVEAAQVASLCRRHGIAHETACWQGNKPATGLAAAAREARYRLLADAAGSIGASAILVGHTRDDQAETVAMRAARGEGAGLAGMARATLFDGRVWIVRPLLASRRQVLRRWLGERGIDWIDDPSNDDPAYERVRTRRRLGEDETAALAARAEEQGRLRQIMAGKAAALIDRFASRPAPGLLRLDPAFLDQPPDERNTAILALRALLATAGGVPRLPDTARVQALFDRLAQSPRAAPLRATPVRATLSRAAIDARASGIFLRREARDLPVLQLDGEARLWDGRLRVAAGSSMDGFSIRPLGHDATTAVEAEAPPALIRTALAAEPGLFRQEVLIGPLPAPTQAARNIAATHAVASYARFLPGFDYPLAVALHRLVGAPALFAPPWREHIATGA